MSYNKEKVLIYDSKKGYNTISKQYGKFHKKLDNWDNGLSKKFFPRNLSGLNIIDLGAGDGRVSKLFENKSVNSYIACDISDQIIKLNKNRVEKRIMNLEETPYDFPDNYFDLALCFFVLLHINDIKKIFSEVNRIIKKGGKFIVLHHIERRPNVYKTYDNIDFKIKTYIHRYEIVEKVAENEFFEIDIENIYENNILIGKIYCFTKT